MLKKLLIALIIISFVIFNLKAGEDNMVKLPEPQRQGGMPLMEALNKRKTIRDFKDKKLSEQTLSNLLWAAFGINRPESGKRTAPSAVNWQEIEIYVSSKSGVYLYNAQQHALEKIINKDIREQTGSQDFVDDAAINLVFVADYTKMGEDMTDEAKKYYSWCDTGYISQNVYLFCASEGLATVVRGMVDRDKLRKIINLKNHQRIVLAQTVGYPK